MFFQDKTSAYFFLLVSGIHIKTKRILEKRLKEFGLTFPQFGVIMSLMHKDRITQKQLADWLETDTTNIMVICDSLEKKDILQRVPNPKDRRSNLLTLTDKGISTFQKAQPFVDEYSNDLMAYITHEEITSVIPVIEKTYFVIKELTKK